MSSILPLPAQPRIPQLQFRDKPYDVSRMDLMEIFQENVRRVSMHIKNNLPNFTGLNGIVKLSLGDALDFSSPPIYIESTSSDARLIDSIPDGIAPTLVVEMMPEYILDVIEGRMHAMHAFTKFARQPCRGLFPLCFIPRGCPSVLPASVNIARAELPKLTDDIKQIKSDLARWGYALVRDALSLDQVAILKKAVEEQAAGERLAGVAHIDGVHVREGDHPNQRVWSLPSKGDEFLDLLNHPLLDALMPWSLGDGFKLHSMSANIAHPAKSGIYMHRDQMGLAPETIDHAYLLNAMWYLVDVTEERGATRVYPGSHNKNAVPAVVNSVGGSIAAAAPAGSCVLLDSRIWHSTGINTSTETRPVILQAFCRFYIQSMENYADNLSIEAKYHLSDRQLGLLGFRIPARGGKRVQAYTAYNHPGAGCGKMRAPIDAALFN
ncbi:putative Dioxygenase [Seiridium cardinale]